IAKKAPRIQWARGRRKSARTLPNLPLPRNGGGMPLSPALRGAEIADWTPWGDHLCRGNDGIGIDPIVPVEVGDGTRLAEMLDTEWPDAVAVDRAEPCQGRRVAIQHSDNAAISGQTGKQPLDVRAGMDKSTFAGATGRGPARIQTVGRSDRQQPDIPAILRHQPDSLDRFWRDRAGIRHYQLAIRPGWPQPIRAVDNGLSQGQAHIPLGLLDRPGRQPQINRAAGLVSQPIAFGSFAAAVALNVVQSKSENDGEFIDEGRLKSCETILGDTDQ